MKIKNLTIFSLAIAVLCTALRTATLLYITEETTGFFKAKLSAMGIFLSLLVFALALVAAIFAFTVKEKPVCPYKPNSTAGIAMIIFGITIFISVFGSNNIVYSAAWQKTALTVTGILAGGWFLAFGMGTIKKLTIPPVCAVFPCIYFVIRLIAMFTNFSTCALVGEHVFSLSYHTFVMVFAFIFGRFAAGIVSKKHLLLLFPIGVTTVIFSFTSVFSRLIVSFIGKKHLIHGEVSVDIVGVVFCLMAVLLLLDLFKEKEFMEEENNAI